MLKVKRRDFVNFVLGVPLSIVVAAARTQASPISQAARLTGSYKRVSPSNRPFVFYSASDYEEIAHGRSPVIQQALAYLEAETRTYVSEAHRYAQVYSGCEIHKYLYELTFEQPGGGAAAAFVANTLSTYGFLASYGYGDPVLARHAVALARDILLRWARSGFRKDGQFRKDFHQYCDSGETRESAWADLPLQLARGMPRWVNAQDLLVAVGKFSSTEMKTLNDFLDNMFQLVRMGSNYRAQVQTLPCLRFSNHASAEIEGLLAIARLRDRDDWVEGAAYGKDDLLTVAWTQALEGNIYGVNDHPRACYLGRPEPGAFAETADVAEGEIVDRYRAGTKQTFGYPMFSLTSLMMAGRILQRSGFNSFEYFGSKKQSILAAIKYYSYYFIKFLSGNTAMVPHITSSYPDFSQYLNKQISGPGGSTISGADGLLLPYLMASSVFPAEPSVSAVIDVVFSRTSIIPAFSRVDPLYLPWIAKLHR